VASRRIAVCLGGTPAKQTFASALDWPGWCVGVGRDESAALAAASYAERYAPWRWDGFTSTVALDVVEWGPGSARAHDRFRRTRMVPPFLQVTAEAEPRS
jgi:hypothetical protein